MAWSDSATPFRLNFFLCLTVTVFLTWLGMFHAPNFVQPQAELLQTAYRLTQATVHFTQSVNSSHDEVKLLGKPIRATLPDVWDKSQPNFRGYGWYEMELALDLGKPLPDSVFIPRSIMNIEVFLNGERIGGQGQMQDELSRNWNRPFLYYFPTSLLKERGNTLTVKVAGYENYRSGLGRIWVGPQGKLEPLFEKAQFWQVTASMVASMIALATAIVILLTAAFIPGQKIGLTYLGLAILIWVIRNIGYYQDWAPFPHAIWGQTVHTLHAWFGCLYGQFMLQYMNVQNSWAKKALWLYALGVTALIFGIGSDSILQFTAFLLAPIIPTLLVLDIMLLGQSWRTHNSEGLLLGFTSMMFLILSIRDLLSIIGWLEYEAVLLSQFTGALFFFSGSAVVLHRYREALFGLLQSNTHLNNALQAREQQLVAQFDMLRDVEKQRTQDAERRRIMQDIHDGVGSSLVSALNAAETRPLTGGEMKEVLQECLDDLRFAIDSLDPQSDDLLALLGNFRWRFDRRLRSAGIELLWDVEEVPKLENYTSREIFELLRILQEALGNVLKHAKACRIKLSIRWKLDTRQILITLEDDGCGFDPNSTHPGRGLSHMKMRAKSIPAELFFTPGLDGQGTGVHLIVQQTRGKPPNT
ncbi:MAG: hypothetical protein QE278_10665 [Limnobacter sp.]|nr:hypothetical protein [Limnobacter sp.]